MLNKLTNGDTLIICKLDRLARSLSQGSDLVNDLIEKGIKVNILNIGIMDNIPTSKLIRNIFFAFAKFERDMIIKRTGEGKAIARIKTGFHDGRPKKFIDEQFEHSLSLLNNHTYKEVEKIMKISKSTLIREKRKRVLNSINV